MSASGQKRTSTGSFDQLVGPTKKAVPAEIVALVIAF
jgi:hypothetical protein